MANAAEKLVLDFCAAWERKNVDELLGFLAPDAVYHNMPVEPLRGIEAIGETLRTFITPAERVEFDVLAVASAGDLVFTERIDRFIMMDKTIALPVAGVFEVHHGKIVAWRDYFDMNTWLRQTTAA